MAVDLNDDEIAGRPGDAEATVRTACARFPVRAGASCAPS